MKLVKYFGQVESLIGQLNVTSCLPEGTNGKKVTVEPWKNRRHIVNYQFNLAAIHGLFMLFMVGWLVELWCTRSRDSAPLIKSRNFLRNIIGTSFLN